MMELWPGTTDPESGEEEREAATNLIRLFLFL